MANQDFNYNCPVQNRYSDGGLSEEEEMLTDNTHHQPVSKVNKSIIDKPPPLIVKMTTAPILKQLIAPVTKVFNLKFMANAVKINNVMCTLSLHYEIRLVHLEPFTF